MSRAGELEQAVADLTAAAREVERADQQLQQQLAKSDLCWWQMVGYSQIHRQPFHRLAPTELPAILVAEGALLSRGVLPLRPLASFLSETARRHGRELPFDDALAQLRPLLPAVPDDDPATGGPHA